jgi:hypothetical protein
MLKMLPQLAGGFQVPLHRHRIERDFGPLKMGGRPLGFSARQPNLGFAKPGDS